jgi:SAM-dependent methyltransferase
MHDSARRFTLFVKNILPNFFENKTILDVGAGDINGNNRFLFVDCEYNGNDVINAPNVTIVSKTKDLIFSDNYFDTIISTECFEHDPEYRESLAKIYQMLKPGGLFTFTCASTGRNEHGTRRTTPQDSYGTLGGLPEMSDYYGNLVKEDIDSVLKLNKSFSSWNTYYSYENKDLYFIGIKNGSELITLPEYCDEYTTIT